MKLGGSKYRHIKATQQKREKWYLDVNPSSHADFTSVSSSQKHVAYAYNSTGGGSAALVSLDAPGKTPLRTVGQHTDGVVVVSFNPIGSDGQQLATASKDGTVQVHDVGADECTQTAAFRAHGKPLSALSWHPCAADLLLTASADKSVRLWRVTAPDAPLWTLTMPDSVFWAEFSPSGRSFAVLCKDKSLAVYDARQPSSGAPLFRVAVAHEGLKTMLGAWVDDEHVVTTGCNKLRTRQVSLWKVGQAAAVASESMDSATGALMPLVDRDAQMLYVAGKGEGSIAVFELQVDKKPHLYALSPLSSSDSQLGVCMVPKLALDVMQCEVARILKLTAAALIPVSYEVPRKTHLHFASDLYPDTCAPFPSMTAEEWVQGGSDSPPLRMSVDPAERESSLSKHGKHASSSNPSSSATSKNSAQPSPTPSHVPSQTSPHAAESEPHSQSTAVEKAASPVASTMTPLPGHDTVELYVPKTIQIVRSTKYRHLVTKMDDAKKHYTNVKAAPVGTDASAIRANVRHIAVAAQGVGGQVLVLPTASPRKLPDRGYGALENGSGVVALEFSPFEPDLLAVGLENATIKLWRLPSDGETPLLQCTDNLRAEYAVLKGHGRKLNTLTFHPLAKNVLASSGMDYEVRLWDIAQAKPQITLQSVDAVVQSVWFNYLGNQMASLSKDKKLRLWDPRAATRAIGEAEAHSGAKAQRGVWLGNSTQLLTTGFSSGSFREIKLYDTRKLAEGPLSSVQVDTGTGGFEPHYDEDTGVLALFAMGDGSIRFYEISAEAPFAHHLTDFSSNVPQTGIALLPKTAVNVSAVEMLRGFKLSGSSVIGFSVAVPRTRNEFFQDDVYPPTRDGGPALSADEWLAGSDREPRLVSLKPEGMQNLSDAPKVVRLMPKFDAAKVETAPKGDLQDQVASRFFTQMQGHKEEAEQLPPQEYNEGVGEDEWDDY